MGAGGDIYGIPQDAIEQEARVLQRGVGNPGEMASHLFLSALRQERLLSRIAVSMEILASELGPSEVKPRGKVRGG